MKKEESTQYVAPMTKVISVNSQSIICESERGAIMNSTEMTEGDDNW